MIFGQNRALRIDLLQTLKGAVTLGLNPGRADATPDIEDGLRNLKATQLAVEYVKQNPETLALIQSQYIAPPPDLDTLAALPAGSLGHCFAKYIEETGFDPNYYRPLPLENDTAYILTRLRQTHDIWHLVTGLGFDVNGELGLQAFCLAQIRIPLPVLLIAGGLLRHLLTSPETLGDLLDQIAIGYRLGATTKPFLAQRWEDHWDRPLSEWRDQLGVVITKEYVPSYDSSSE